MLKMNIRWTNLTGNCVSLILFMKIHNVLVV